MGRRLKWLLSWRFFISFRLVRPTRTVFVNRSGDQVPEDPSEAAVYWRGEKQFAHARLVEVLERKAGK